MKVLVLDIETFTDILEEYCVSYKIMCDFGGRDVKGRINYETKHLYINPVYPVSVGVILAENVVD